MKAVNLLPSELRGAAAGGSGSPAGSYALLAALAVLVVIAATWAISARQVDDRRADVARLDAEAQAAEAEVQDLAGFEQTVSVATARKKVVTDLAKSRMDWAEALLEVSRTVPDTAWITSMSATTAPGVSVEGGGNPLRSALTAPAVELVGCTPRQDDVARLMTRLRAMDGVQKVNLSTTEKSDAGSGGGSGSGAGDTDCRAGSSSVPQFNMVVFFRAPAGAAATTTATAGAAPGTAATTEAGAK